MKSLLRGVALALMCISITAATAATTTAAAPLPAPTPTMTAQLLTDIPPLLPALALDLPSLSPSALMDDLKRMVKEQIRGTIDNWAIDQVDKPIGAMRGLYTSVVLDQPSLLAPGQTWVLQGWGLGLLFGLMLLTFAFLNHSRHTLKGTDLLRGRNPFARFGVPLICLLAMLTTPFAWETVSATQRWVWSGDGFQRSDPDAVLGVVFPAPAAENGPVDPNGRGAGSVASVSSSLGVGVGIGSGFVVTVFGLLGFLGYWVGRMLIIVSAFYLGITAFSHRLEPTIGWLNVTLRTALLPSVFNLGWLAMRQIPGWMRWLPGVEASVFVCFVLPLLLIFLWHFWLRKVLDLIRDPLLLNGGQVMEGVGKKAGSMGTVLTVAGALVGMPGLAAAGGTLSSWGARTASSGAQLTKAAKEEGPMAAAKVLFADRIKAVQQPTQSKPTSTQAPGPAQPPASTEATPSAPTESSGPPKAAAEAAPVTQEPASAAESPACWTDGGQFVSVVKGVPTWSPTQPPGTRVVGPWEGLS